MLFSVVIPTYNREKEISRAVTSVINQTMGDFEIIVVDDGSTDKTVCVVEKYTDPRLRVIKQKNSGATVARNTGIENAKGIYISFLDSDDEWMPCMLEKQKQVYDSNPSIGCVYSNVIIKSDATGKRRPFGRKLGVDGSAYKKILEQGYMAPTTVLSAKRDLLINVGMFDTTLPASQDDDMCFKLAKNTTIGYIPEILAVMHTGPDNRISKNRKKVALGWWMLWNKYEMDTVELCGNTVMAKHFLTCAIHFAESGDKNDCMLALEKYSSYGKSISTFQKLLLDTMLKTNGIIKRVAHKLIRDTNR